MPLLLEILILVFKLILRHRLTQTEQAFLQLERVLMQEVNQAKL